MYVNYMEGVPNKRQQVTDKEEPKPFVRTQPKVKKKKKKEEKSRD